MLGKSYEIFNKFFELVQQFFFTTNKGRTIIKLLVVLAVVIPCFFKFAFYTPFEESGEFDHDSILLVKVVDDYVTGSVHSVGKGFKNTSKGLSEVFSGLVVAFSHTFRVASSDSENMTKVGAENKADESACCEVSGFKKGHDAYYLLGWIVGADTVLFGVWFSALFLKFRS